MSEGIVYQNKDVLLKILAENYKNKSLSAYGLKLPPIKELLPTNLPVIQVDEKRSDNIFLLEDGRILILEYESDVKQKNLLKYGHYAFRVSEAYYGKANELIIAVIYTGDATKAPKELNLGCVSVRTEQVFLSSFDGDRTYSELKHKVTNNIQLNNDDIMRFIILPLMGKTDKQKRIEEAVDLAKLVVDEKIQTFIIAGLLTASDKFIDRDYSNRLKEWLKMTKIGQLYEEEKIEAVIEAVSEAVQKSKSEIAKNLLDNGADIALIMKSTGLTRADINRLKKAASE